MLMRRRKSKRNFYELFLNTKLVAKEKKIIKKSIGGENLLLYIGRRSVGALIVKVIY